MCPDCCEDPCRCLEYQKLVDAADAEEADRAAAFAETELPYLWETENGLLRRKK